MAADEAERYMKEASRNYHQANVYNDEAATKEKKYQELLNEKEVKIDEDNRELFIAEERFNRTCKQEHCEKSKIPPNSLILILVTSNSVTYFHRRCCQNCSAVSRFLLPLSSFAT